MTRLEKAITKLRLLPKKEQNRFAAMVLDEALWQEAFFAQNLKEGKVKRGIVSDLYKDLESN